MILLHDNADWSFFHIPKTGGTVIEYVAARNGIAWSVCHFVNGIPEVKCPTNNASGDHLRESFPWPQQPKYHNCPWWHLPAQYFDLQPANPYQDADLFVVVRNVYDRIVSEYYFVMTHMQKKSHAATNNVQAFNQFLTQKLVSYHNLASAGHVDRNRTGNARYFANSGHDIPQYDNVYDHRKRVVKHVLRFEHLYDDFDALMKLYNLSDTLRLPQEQIRQPSHGKELGVYNMTKRNLKLIERVYEKDFCEWGYEIMSEKISKEILDRNEQLTARKRPLLVGKEQSQARLRKHKYIQ